MGARGNSGVILSQILRGLADAVRDARWNGRRRAGRRPDPGGRRRLSGRPEPVEGTILTVARRAAEAAATPASATPTWSRCSRRRVRGAAEALARTPDLLPVLEERRGSSTPAGPGSCSCSTPCFMSRPAGPLPDSADGPGAGSDRPRLAGPVGPDGPRPCFGRTALRGHVPAGGARGVPPSVPGGVGGSGRLDRGGGRRRPVELPHPHRRHRRRHRGGPRGRPAPTDPGLRPVGAGRGGALGARGGRHGPQTRSPPPEPVRCAVVAVCTGDGIRRIFRSLGVHQVVQRRPVDEPVHRRPAGRHRRRPRRSRSSSCPTTRTSSRSPSRPPGRPTSRFGSSRRRASRRGSRRCSSTTRRATPTPTGAHVRRARARVVAGEVTRADPGQRLRRRPHRRGRLPRVCPGTASRSSPAGLAEAASQLLDRLIDADHHEIVTIIAGEGAGAADTRRITEWIDAHHPGLSQRGAPRAVNRLSLPLLDRVSA